MVLHRPWSAARVSQLPHCSGHQFFSHVSVAWSITALPSSRARSASLFPSGWLTPSTTDTPPKLPAKVSACFRLFRMHRRACTPLR